MADRMGGLAALLVPEKSGGEGAPVAEKPELDPKTLAAESLIAAVKAGDVDGVAMALQDHYDACAMGGEGEAVELDEGV